MTMFNILGCADIPCPVFRITHLVKLLLQIFVPVVLIIMGMIDFTKATMAHDEGDIVKAKNQFIKRLIAAGSMFFVVSVFQLTFNVIAKNADSNTSDGQSIWKCVNNMLSGNEGSCDNTPFSNEDTNANNGNGQSGTNNGNTPQNN